MKSKKYLIPVILAVIVVGFVSAAGPKLAVIDAIIHSEGKKSIIIPITENIIEALVSSGKYTVLDRAHVAKVFEEQKFQMSGIVKSDEIKKLGNFLGAEFIVVVNVSIIEDIYFISGKVINVESGEILNQASDKKRGDITVIFDVAQAVGVKLAGERPAPPSTPDPDLIIEPETGIEPDPDPLETTAFGEVSYTDYEITSDGMIVFNIYDAMVSGMQGKTIHTEFWISQNDKLVPGSMLAVDPIPAPYEPSFWNGRAFWFQYPISDIRGYVNTSQPYYGVFYIIDTTTDMVIYSKYIDFDINSTTTTTNYNPPPMKAQEYFSRVAFSYTPPALFGNIYEILEEILYSTNYTIIPSFWDFHMLQVMDDIYLSVLLGIYMGDLQDDGYSIDAAALSAINMQVGGGLLFPVMDYVQGYMGIRAGACIMILGEEAWTSGFTGDFQTGFSFGVETGADLILADFMTISTRVQYDTLLFEPGSESDAIFPDFASGTSLDGEELFDLSFVSLSIGLGFSY